MKSLFAASAVLFALSGCAFYIHGPTQAIDVTSVPVGANAVVTNRAGEVVHSGLTPVKLTLKRGAEYFKSEIYTVTFTKEGFAPKQLTITSSVSGWYFGNLLFGGLIGMLAIDPLTGAMYTFPDSVSGDMDAKPMQTSRAVESLTIVSTETLTAEEMKLARLVTQADSVK